MRDGYFLPHTLLYFLKDFYDKYYIPRRKLKDFNFKGFYWVRLQYEIQGLFLFSYFQLFQLKQNNFKINVNRTI